MNPNHSYSRIVKTQLYTNLATWGISVHLSFASLFDLLSQALKSQDLANHAWLVTWQTLAHALQQQTALLHYLLLSLSSSQMQFSTSHRLTQTLSPSLINLNLKCPRSPGQEGRHHPLPYQWSSCRSSGCLQCQARGGAQHCIIESHAEDGWGGAGAWILQAGECYGDVERDGGCAWRTMANECFVLRILKFHDAILSNFVLIGLAYLPLPSKIFAGSGALLCQLEN